MVFRPAVQIGKFALESDGLHAVSFQVRNLLLIATALLLFGCNQSKSTTAQDQSNSLEQEPSVQQLVEQSTISLRNTGAENNSQVDLSPVNDASAYGWNSVGSCLYTNSNIAPGNGKWRFQLGQACQLFQQSAYKVIQGEAYSLIFDASAYVGLPASVTAQLTITNESGETKVVASQEFDFKEIKENNWYSYQLLTGFGELDDFVGKALSVRFVSNSGNNQLLSVDNILLQAFHAAEESTTVFSDSWAGSCDQIWAGESYWANRLQDWQVKGGRLQTRKPTISRLRRTIHRIGSYINASPNDFKLRVNTGIEEESSKGSYNGFLLGAGLRLDYRAAALIHNRSGKNGGIVAAVDHLGRAFIRDNGIINENLAVGEDSINLNLKAVTLELHAQYQSDHNYRLTLSVFDSAEQLISQAISSVSAVRVLGNIALISNPGQIPATAHWFNDFTGAGRKLTEQNERKFGPVLFASYTLSRNVLTLNAQLPPVCEDRYENASLEVMRNGSWEKVATSNIDASAHTAQFRVTDWNDSLATLYRVSLDEITNGETLAHYFEGTIQADPKNKSQLTFTGLTCRPGVLRSPEGWIQQFSLKPFSWTQERLVFPHKELMDNASKHGSDLLVFTGDQIYEFDPNGFVDKSGLEEQSLDYLYKWFQFGWSVRDYIRDIPSIIIPDDHDIYQGNFWGENGRHAEQEADGGYVSPAQFVKMVEKTQTGSLPPAFDPTPVEQNIGVYYTDMVYGGIGIAILEDRKFKTGPNSQAEPKVLLGNRQHAFLDYWADDWKGQEMKIVFSQSPFAASHSHSGDGYNYGGVDQDANGWPKPQRDEALVRLRRVFAPHVNGDQHLGLTLKHGIDQPNDAVYSFSVPSMLNIFARIWDPQNTKNGTGDRSVSYTGDYIEQHGNHINVLAAANPDDYYRSGERPELVNKNQLGTGYGIIRINKPNRTYSFEAWPINEDPLVESSKPYEGWPVTFHQDDNDGRTPVGFLPQLTAAVDNPVIHVIDESDNQLVYAKRLSSKIFTPPVYALDPSYTVRFSDPDTGYEELIRGLRVSE